MSERPATPNLSSDNSSLSSVQDWDELELEQIETITSPKHATTRTSRAKGRKRTAPVASGPRKKASRSKPTVLSEQNEINTKLEIERTKASPRKRRSQGRGTTNGSTVQVTDLRIKEEVEVERSLGGLAREPQGPRRKVKTQLKTEAELKEETQAGGEEDSTPAGRRKRTRIKSELKVEVDLKEEIQAVGEEEGQQVGKRKRRRKTKEEKEAEAMPLAARAVGLRMYVGAHVSAAKGVHNSITNCVHIGGNAFALFLKSQRKWESPPLNLEHATLFKSHCKDHQYDSASHILPHGSYLVNLAQKDPERATQAYNCFLDDLKRCEALGIRLYNFHPGWTGPHPRDEGIARIAAALNRAHSECSTVKTVLETMVGREKVIGSTFEDLRDIIALVNDKSRVGVCLDTCHVFAAGYDLRTRPAFENTLEHFDRTVGIKYLCALHLNDSKAPFLSGRDLHQNIGLGFLGLRAFHNVMNEPRFHGLPMVLETPIDRDGKEDQQIWADEIKLLEGLTGMDPDSPDFLAKEKNLADQGRDERAKYQEAFERKQEKEQKAAERATKKRRKRKSKTGTEEEEGDDDNESE